MSVREDRHQQGLAAVYTVHHAAELIGGDLVLVKQWILDNVPIRRHPISNEQRVVWGDVVRALPHARAVVEPSKPVRRRGRMARVNLG